MNKDDWRSYQIKSKKGMVLVADLTEEEAKNELCQVIELLEQVIELNQRVLEIVK
jgi:hypothetical protein